MSFSKKAVSVVKQHHKRTAASWTGRSYAVAAVAAGKAMRDFLASGSKPLVWFECY